MPVRNVKWDRQPGEPVLWYGRFWSYCQLGPKRTVITIYREHKKKEAELKGIPYKEPKDAMGSWKNMVAKWRWTERASQWDEECIRAEREAHERDIKETRRKHRDYGRIMQSIGLKRLANVATEEITPVAASSFIQDGIKVELGALGVASEIVETRNRQLDPLEDYESHDLDKQIAALEARISAAETGSGAEGGAGQAQETPGGGQGVGAGGSVPPGPVAPGEAPASGADEPS